MANGFNNWINNVTQSFMFVEIADKKHSDVRWRKVIRPSFLAVTSLFIMFMLFLCNAAVNELYIGRKGTWAAAGFGPDFQNCSARDEFAFDYRPLENATSQQPLGKGTESLPKGIVEATSDLELRHLWQIPDRTAKTPHSLLAMAVGIKQKSTADQIVQKFPEENYTVMLFHYDGKVDNWTDLAWSARAIHVMAFNQTKWWFAKRFLHPDIVHIYNYIFLWDEDLGVEHFHADRYLDIMEDEGFEISQPALHRNSTEVHHRLTVLNRSARAHRRIYSYAARHQCDAHSNGPPCTGWVEMMAPVFSRAAWRCTWNMIQNDLVHAWGLDYKLGYCAQGERSEKVGIIDAEFIVHQGIPSLGGPRLQKTAQAPFAFEGDDSPSGSGEAGLVHSMFITEVDVRAEIRKRARAELDSFSRQWRRAAASDPNWVDPYKQPEVTSVEVTSEDHSVDKEGVKPTDPKRRKKSKKTTSSSTQKKLLWSEELNGTTVAVTEATGLINSCLVKELLERDCFVRATVRNLDEHGKLRYLLSLPRAQERLTLYKVDLLHENAFDNVVDGVDYVFHSASPFLNNGVTHPRAVNFPLDPAIKGSVNLLQAAAKAKTVKRVVLTSSVSSVLYTYNNSRDDSVVRIDEIWRDDTEHCKEQKSWDPMFKTKAEEAVWDMVMGKHFDLVLIDPVLVVGTNLQPTINQRSSTVAKCFSNAANAHKNDFIGFVDARDVAQVQILAEKPEAKGRYIVCEKMYPRPEIAHVLDAMYPPVR